VELYLHFIICLNNFRLLVLHLYHKMKAKVEWKLLPTILILGA